MGKEIVGNFNKDLSKIEFYEIVDNYKIYTIIRKQVTDKYYLYDNKLGVLSEELDITELPKDKNKYDEILGVTLASQNQYAKRVTEYEH